MRLKDKVAFVSGGASGIGRAIVSRFQREGARVFFGDLNEVNGAAVANETGAQYVRLDVADETSWQAAIAIVDQMVGRLDILVNNAGVIGTPAMIEDMDLAQWQHVMNVNVNGVMLGCKHGSRLMLRNPGGPQGSIVNMSSISGIQANPGPAYPTSKGAVRLMTKAVAADFAFRDIAIRCNSIHPGGVDTPIFDPWRQGSNEEVAVVDKALTMTIPMGRLGRPEEIASMALFLASDESSFSTGAEFLADGGSTCTAPKERGASWMINQPGTRSSP